VKTGELIERISKRCPFQPGSGGWAHWIGVEMDKSRRVEEDSAHLGFEILQEQRRHRDAMAKFEERRKEIQQVCPHDKTKWHADPAGGSDSWMECETCGANIEAQK